MKVEISNGELVDKITILSLKLVNITDESKAENIKKEYDFLVGSLKDIGMNEHSYLYRELWQVNQELWIIEDNIREKEKGKEFGEEFIELARSVYVTNDRRCEIKKQINIETDSDIIEEKSYEDY